MSEPKSFGSVIESAFDEVLKEPAAETKTETVAPVAEDKVEAPATTPEAKVEPKAAETAADKLKDEDLNLSAEEMAAIAADPKLAKVYKSMQRGLTHKTTSLAEERRKLSERQSILEQIEADPEQAAIALARVAGLEITRPQGAARTQSAVDEASAKMAELFGPEAAGVLKPVFEQLVRGVLENEVAPLKQDVEAQKAAAFEQAMGASVEQFKAGLGEDLDPETETEMVALMGKIKPGKDTGPVEYLKFLHTHVTAGKVRAKATQEAAERIRVAAAKQEPVAGVRAAREPETGVSLSKSFSSNFSSAFDEAVREAGRR